jgi:hypothetical protein
VTVARARRYPIPPPVAEVLAAERCDHGAVAGRCPLCRVAAEHADDRNEAAATQPDENAIRENGERS